MTWRWLRLSKRQSPTTVLLGAALILTITLYELLILLGSNHLLYHYHCQCHSYQDYNILQNKSGSSFLENHSVDLSSPLQQRNTLFIILFIIYQGYIVRHISHCQLQRIMSWAHINFVSSHLFLLDCCTPARVCT